MGTRPHQVTLGGASHTTYVKTAVPSDSAALELLSLPGQLGSVAQGNRCLKPENYHPVLPPPQDPAVRSSLLFGWPRGQGQRKGKNERQAGGRGGVLSCSGLIISLCSLEFTCGGGGASQGTNQRVKGTLQV